MMRAGFRGCIRNTLKLITLSQRNIPIYRFFEAEILHRGPARMPGEKDLDNNIISTRQTLIQRGVVLDWVRNDNSKLYSRSMHGTVTRQPVVASMIDSECHTKYVFGTM